MSFFLFLSLSFSQANSLECRSPLSSLSCLGLQDPCERAPCAYVKQCKSRVKGFIGFLHKPRNIRLFLTLFYFLIVDSGPPGSGPLKDLNTGPQNSAVYHMLAPKYWVWLLALNNCLFPPVFLCRSLLCSLKRGSTTFIKSPGDMHQSAHIIWQTV